jgi:organic hydroperoxide reductase OsmC/OhrA
LSAAVGHCLSSSLLFCLSRAKIKARNMETTVKTNIARNEEGHSRVQGIEAQIRLDVDEKDKPRLPRCLEIFENYCTVTASVRKGIEVKVNVI